MHLRSFWRCFHMTYPHRHRLRDSLPILHKAAISRRHSVPNSSHGHRRLCSTVADKPVEELTGLKGTRDRHRGIHVHVPEEGPLTSPEHFDQQLQESIPIWQEAGLVAAWLRVPIMVSELIPVAARHGFTFHHAEGGTASLYRWLPSDQTDKVPRFATHQVGVAGCVLREDTKEVLMVQDKNRPYTLWKFPGGLSDLAEDISITAEREVYEETGIKAEFQGILSFRQQHHMPNAFGRSDLFFVCHLRPRTLDLHPDYAGEIAKCQWMEVQSVLDNPEASNFTKNICSLLKHGLEHNFENVHFASKKMKSVYQGLTFKMYYPKVINEVT